MTRRLLGTLLVAGASATGIANAQGSRTSHVAFTVGAGATYGNLAGGDLSGTKAAAGFDANVGLELRRWQLGVGYDRTTHGRDETSGDYVVSNIYFEPRLRFATPLRKLTPYAALRLGRAMATYEGVLGITDTAAGYIGGVGAGVLWPITARVQADAAAHYDLLSHDYGNDGYAAAEKGGRTSVRLGIRLSSSDGTNATATATAIHRKGRQERRGLLRRPSRTEPVIPSGSE